MSDEAERTYGYRFPGPAPARTAPRPSGTLEEILASMNAPQVENRVDADFTRIEHALSRLEQAVRDALEEDRR